MTREHRVLLCALLCVLTACTPAPRQRAGDSDEESGSAPAPTNRVAIPATVRHNLGITFAEVEARAVARTLRAPGSFELRPAARREYRMALSGRVQLLVDQYQRVEEGGPLYRYRSPEWPDLVSAIVEAEQAMKMARAGMRVDEAELAESRKKARHVRDRIAALGGADFKRADLEARAAELDAAVPRLEAELELARTRFENAEGSRRQALQRAAAAPGTTVAELEEETSTGDGGERVPRYLALDWIEVRAEGSGVVETLSVTNGAFVESPGLVLTTIDPDRLRFRAQALQADLSKLLGATDARIVPPPSPDRAPSGGVPAAMSVGLEARPKTRTVALVAEPARREEWMRPGVSAFLEIVVEGTGGPALAVPRSAVVQDGLTHVVFRRDPSDPNQAIRVEADMGVSDGRWVVLNSGVVLGDEVVLNGAYELRLATQRSGAAQEGGHFHADGSFHGEH